MCGSAILRLRKENPEKAKALAQKLAEQDVKACEATADNCEQAARWFYGTAPEIPQDLSRASGLLMHQCREKNFCGEVIFFDKGNKTLSDAEHREIIAKLENACDKGSQCEYLFKAYKEGSLGLAKDEARANVYAQKMCQSSPSSLACLNWRRARGERIE
jgi:hypothetical protein